MLCRAAINPILPLELIGLPQLKQMATDEGIYRKKKNANCLFKEFVEKLCLHKSPYKVIYGVGTLLVW